MSRRILKLWLPLVTLVTVASACSAATQPSPQVDGVTIVATTNILGDLAENIAGDRGTVDVLIPIGADPHDYQASAQQVAQLHDADLVLANGLALEQSLTDVLEAAAEDGANVMQLGGLLDPRPFGGEDGSEDDPHFWLDPVRMSEAALLVAGALSKLDPSVDWDARGASYAAELTDAHGQIEEILDRVAPEHRKLVTNHDALGYFADRYSFAVVGVVIPGGSTLADPSSAELGQLVAIIERENVQAVFAETTEPSVLAEAVAAEVGGQVAVVELFTGSLGGPGSGAESLIEMLLTNANRIADALTGSEPTDQ